MSPLTSATRIVLHQFPHSHFNEKARWVLDWKGVAHERRNYLPGPHAGPITKLSGQRSTPVLEIDDEVISGSAQIAAALEERFPDPSLLPGDDAGRSQVLQMQAEFDRELGPAVRAAGFAVMLECGNYVARMFGSPHPAIKRFVYGLAFPIARGKVQAAYRTNDRDYIERCHQTIDHELDEIARRTKSSGHLVGDRFTLADLTAAALLAPLANPDHPDMRRPEPIPVPVREWVGRWQDHEAMQWVRQCYRKHRCGPQGDPSPTRDA